MFTLAVGNSQLYFGTTVVESDSVQLSGSGGVCTAAKPSDSDILRCNKRIVWNFRLDLGDRLWKAVAKLGAVMENSHIDL